jgi:hypothetical protein
VPPQQIGGPPAAGVDDVLGDAGHAGKLPDFMVGVNHNDVAGSRGCV